MMSKETDVKIRTILLFEYCKRSYGQSDNPEMHFYTIPELRNIDNGIIKANAVYLIAENLVRGGVDEDTSHSFPWITRINSTGMKLVERIVDESESKIPELQDNLKDKTDTQDRVLGFIAYCFKFKDVPTEILDVAKKIVL
jgi:hypothetical protein